jgi:hypothetical protein
MKGFAVEYSAFGSTFSLLLKKAKLRNVSHLANLPRVSKRQRSQVTDKDSDPMQGHTERVHRQKVLGMMIRSV